MAAVPNDTTPVLSVRGATKRFGAVTAIRDVSFELHARRVLALLGDNGAGKSTIVKCLSGVHALDEGKIALDGEGISISSARDARRHGIETVFQDLALFDNLSAADNFFAGREKVSVRQIGWFGFLRRREMREATREILDEMKVHINDVSLPVGLMSGGQRQAIAVARAKAFGRRVVILDEPTAALGLRESARVIDMIKRLPDLGVSVILISHNMSEVIELATNAVVLRNGRKVGECVPSPENHERIVSMIVGGGAQV